MIAKSSRKQRIKPQASSSERRKTNSVDAFLADYREMSENDEFQLVFTFVGDTGEYCSEIERFDSRSEALAWWLMCVNSQGCHGAAIVLKGFVVHAWFRMRSGQVRVGVSNRMRAAIEQFRGGSQ